MIHLLFLLKKGVGNIFQVHINGLIFYVIGWLSLKRTKYNLTQEESVLLVRLWSWKRTNYNLIREKSVLISVFRTQEFV